MKSSLLTGLLLFFSIILFAQVDDRIAETKTPLSAVEQVVMPLQNNKQLHELEMAARRPGRAPKFAEAIEVNITPETHGNWENLPNGNALWRIRLQSLGAKSLNLGFTEFFLPSQSSLILYTPDQKIVRGPFTPADNEEHNQLWTPVILSSDLVIELQVPQSKKSAVQLRLTSVNHDFMGFLDPESGSCNLDVICGAGDGWEVIDNYRDIIQSVAMYTRNGTRNCTGFLVNNTRQDCTPFFMTADHCGMDENTAPSMVAYWNFESPECRQPNTVASSGTGVGSLDIFNTGAILRATAGATDFTLLELDDPVAEEANAFFAGWDTKESAPANAVCIHHPNTDEKRISFENDPLNLADQGGNASTTGNYLAINDWDIGTTEPGSSGAPLFDQTTKRVIGQLFGGQAACGNDDYDVYGRFAISYVGNGTPEASLQTWLDPDGTGLSAIDGRWARACNFFVEAEQPSLDFCQDGTAEYSLAISENFMDTVFITIDSMTIPTNAQLIFSTDSIRAGDTIILSIPNISEIPAGDYAISLTGTDGVDSTTTELNLSIFADIPTEVELLSPIDGAENVSLVTPFNWVEQGNGTFYDIQISTDSTFATIDVDSTSALAISAFSSPSLQEETQYFWRVRATNACGQNDWTPTASFTTAQVICANFASDNVPVSINNGPPGSYTSTLNVLTNGEIVDLNVVNLRGEHTWIADLGFTLTSPNGTTVTLVTPTCFDEDDFNLNLDDEAAPVELPCPYNEGGTYRPSGALAEFNGENPQGIWTLTVIDGQSQDGGQLLGWGLDFCAAILGDFTATPSITEASLCSEETLTFGLKIGTDFSAESFALNVENLPEGSTIDYGTERVQPGDSLTVTINNFQAGTSGDYNILFTATDGEETALSQISLALSEAPAASNLSQPLNGASNVPATTTLRFGAVALSDDYLLEIATDENFATIVVSETLDNPLYNANLELDTRYYWRVTTRNNCGSVVSEVFNFFTLKDISLTAAPDAVTACLTEQIIVTLSVGINFEESGATISAIGLPEEITFTYSENPVPPGGMVDVVIDGFDVLAAGNYSITFNANDGTNNQDEVVELTLLDIADATTLTTPEDEATLVAPQPEFTWETVPSTDEYIIEVSNNGSFENADLIISETVLTNVYTPSIELEMGTYFWRVSTQNLCGGMISSPSSFTVESSSTENIAGFEFIIAPNPTNDWFSLNFNQAIIEQVQVNLFTVDGRLMFNDSLNQGTTHQRFSTNSLAAGIYFLQLQTKDGVVNRKLIIQ